MNKTIQELEALNRKLSVLTGVSQPIYYKALGKFIGIVKVTDKIRGNLKIPYGVTSINFRSFSDCIHITSIILPDTVECIRDLAFVGCLSLTSASIPRDVVKEEQAFENCPNVIITRRKQYLAETEEMNKTIQELELLNKKLSVLTGVSKPIDYKVTDKDIEITKVTDKINGNLEIPYGVTIIGKYSFAYCKNMTSVEIPDSVNEILEGAFTWCKSLECMQIPDNVNIIEHFIFGGCSSLRSISISKETLYWERIQVTCPNIVIIRRD